MRKFLLLLLLLGFLASSCGDDDDAGPTSTVNLNFKATYDGDPLVFTLNNYTYPDGKLIQFNRLNFFVSDVVLLESNGNGEVEVEDIAFVDFSGNSSVTEAETPITITNNKVPAGTYKGLRISFGVPADLNKSSSTELPAGNPLRDFMGEFWSDWDSYIFLKSEGKYDKNGSGQFGDVPKEGFEHHPGTDEVYTTLSVTEPFEVKEGETLEINLSLDVLKLYVKDGVALDLQNEDNLNTQSPSDIALAKFIMDNLAQALTLEK